MLSSVSSRYVHEGQLRFALVAPDGMKWGPDASERQKLTVHAPHDFEEGVRIEPYARGTLVRLPLRPR